MAPAKGTPFLFLKRRAIIAHILPILCFSAFASEPHGEGHGDTQAVHSARTSSRDVMLPSALVNHVEKSYEDFLKKEGVLGKPPIKRKLVNVRIDLAQKRPGALHEDIRVNTPLGGGVVDLADLVTPVKGAFSAKILATAEDNSNLDHAHVYFVSRAKSRAIGPDTYGAGCHKWMDITSYFNKTMSRGGFQLYTAD